MVSSVWNKKLCTGATFYFLGIRRQKALFDGKTKNTGQIDTKNKDKTTENWLCWYGFYYGHKIWSCEEHDVPGFFISSFLVHFM